MRMFAGLVAFTPPTSARTRHERNPNPPWGRGAAKVAPTIRRQKARELKDVQNRAAPGPAVTAHVHSRVHRTLQDTAAKSCAPLLPERAVPTNRRRYTLHPRGGSEAGARVLEDEAALGDHVQAARGFEKGIGVDISYLYKVTICPSARRAKTHLSPGWTAMPPVSPALALPSRPLCHRPLP